MILNWQHALSLRYTHSVVYISVLIYIFEWMQSVKPLLLVN